MEHLSNIKLVPLIHLSLFDVDDSFYPDEIMFDMEQRDRYWKQVLEKYGISGIEAIEKGEELISVSEFHTEALQHLIKWFLKDWMEFEWQNGKFSFVKLQDEEFGRPPSFYGGVMMTSNDRIMICSQCCVGLQDHREWRDLEPSGSFKRIWIGHPWIYYKVKGDKILFTRLIEKELNGETWRHYNSADNSLLRDFSDFEAKPQEDIDDRDLKYSVDHSVFKRAVEDLEKQLNTFKSRIEKILIEAGMKNAAEVADCLVNGNGVHLSY